MYAETALELLETISALYQIGIISDARKDDMVNKVSVFLTTGDGSDLCQDFESLYWNEVDPDPYVTTLLFNAIEKLEATTKEKEAIK